MAVANKMILGSGKLYMLEWATSYATTFPDDSTIEAAGNQVAYISGGATFEYTPEFYEAKDDLGYVSKNIITSDETKLTCGLCTFDANVLKKICPTAGTVTSTTTEQSIVGGGAGNDDGKRYIIRFVHEDAADGDTRLTIVGRNTAALSISFAKDQETVVNPEFVGMSGYIDSSGHTFKFAQEIPTTSGGGSGNPS